MRTLRLPIAALASGLLAAGAALRKSDPDEAGGYHGQMAVLVKPNGPFGNAYMAAIRPFRHLVVYPALMRQFERTLSVGDCGGWSPRCRAGAIETLGRS